MDTNKNHNEPNENEFANSDAIGSDIPNITIGDNSDNNTIIWGTNNTVINQTINRTPEQVREDRKRHAMLDLVHDTWVNGVLEKSLYENILIDLGLEVSPNRVTRSWEVQVQMPDQVNRILPPSTPIIDVFDEMQGELLILGVPGSGKTTMLLELARDCIARAKQDDTQPIPVVFNLSSYHNPKQSFDLWLVNELDKKYHISKKVAQAWIENEELLLLLDGLDEIKQVENREACVRAINIFRQKHGLVVCSRIADYDSLTENLHLRGAVFLQPLTDRQVEDYFTVIGPKLNTAHQLWQQDTELREILLAN